LEKQKQYASKDNIHLYKLLLPATQPNKKGV